MIRLSLPLPKGDGCIYPAFGHGVCTQTEPMGQSLIGMELGGNAQGRELLQAVLHRAPRGNPIVFAYADESGGIAPADRAISRVLHDDRRCLWHRSITGQLPQVIAIPRYGCHTGTRTASP